MSYTGKNLPEMTSITLTPSPKIGDQGRVTHVRRVVMTENTAKQTKNLNAHDVLDQHMPGNSAQQASLLATIV